MRYLTFLTRSAGILLLTCLLLTLALAQRPGGGGPPGQGPGGPPRGQGGPGGPPRPFGGDPDRPGGPGRNGPPRPGDERRPPPDARVDFISHEILGDHKVVKNAPYSADVVQELTQVLADGTRITHKSTTNVARDGEGRTRRELKLDLNPILGPGDIAPLILIDDPAAKLHYVLNDGEKTALKSKNPKNPPPDGEEGRAFAPDDNAGQVESLGTKMIEGVMAEGTRSTITIPVGQIGNDRPLQIVSERWYSPELKAVVLSTHSDPRNGENVFRLTNLKRGEPDPALFQVPADYRVEEDKPRSQDRRPQPPTSRDDLPRMND